MKIRPRSFALAALAAFLSPLAADLQGSSMQSRGRVVEVHPVPRSIVYVDAAATGAATGQDSVPPSPGLEAIDYVS